MTDLVGMYLQAITFLDCACLCNETAGLGKGSARSIYLGTPVIVNSAFACEIFLKLLLAIFNIKYGRCHELKKLFDLLPEETREKINSYLIQNYGTLKDENGFELLQMYSNAFTEWRYSYEKYNLRIEQKFLFLFCEILKKECEDKLGWKGYDGREK